MQTGSRATRPLPQNNPPARLKNSQVSTDPALRTVSNRWTPRLAAEGWTPVVAVFLHNYHRLKIRAVEALFIVHLMSFKWDKKAPFPRFGLLAKHMGVSPAAARSYARSLERKGLLMRQARVGSASRFYLQPLFEALHKLLDADAKAKVPAATPQTTPSPRVLALANKILDSSPRAMKESRFRYSDPASHVLQALALLGEGSYKAEQVAVKADEPIVKVRHFLESLCELGYAQSIRIGKKGAPRYSLNKKQIPLLIEQGLL
jgi:hypothetical protein